MNNDGDQSLFRDYQDYIDYQVNKCVTPIDHPYYKDVSDSHLRIITDYLGGAQREVSILDCGCGYGFALRAFRHCGFKNVVGADVSDNRLAAAKEVGYPVQHVDMHEMREYEDARFDVVYSSHSLEHSLHPEQALAEIYRVIKPGGTLMLILPYPVTLEDEHVAKAHCGAESLGLTIEDNGDTLVRKVEAFGFSLIARGLGAYRDEAEIYLKFVKGSNSPLVKEYGPKSTPVNTTFNIQANGMSALWFVIDDSYEGDLIVEFDGCYLKSARSASTLSALVPDLLLEIPREVVIRVFDAKSTQRQAELHFNVTGAKDNRHVSKIEPDISQPKKPNFFLIGAPRSGTTSIYWELASHPDIFMSRLKEPFFFDKRTYGVLTDAVTTQDEYRELFRYAPMQANIIGEASTTYLSSPSALEDIHAYSPEARILVMLRNPIDASISMFLQMKHGKKYESFTDFETAWRAASSDQRPFVTRYAELFQIGQQLRTAEAIFGRKSIKVVIFDDLVSCGEKVYQDVLDYLELPLETGRHLLRSNSSGYGNIHDMVSKELFEEMVEHFRPEVEIVSDYTQRDLDHWLKP